MTIGQKLEDFRSQISGCTVAAFADVSTEMILAASTETKTTQETLDALCTRAVDRLLSEEASMVASVLSASASQINCALNLTSSGVECFVRSPVSDDEVLCLCLTLGVDIRAATEAAQNTLREIGMEA